MEVHMARDEDYRHGGGSNLISVDGLSRPLSFGEKRCLEQQRRNRADAGKSPGEVEARNLERITVDRGMKAPRFCKYP
jgi:hypothetical protein